MPTTLTDNPLPDPELPTGGWSACHHAHSLSFRPAPDTTARERAARSGKRNLDRATRHLHPTADASGRTCALSSIRYSSLPSCYGLCLPTIPTVASWVGFGVWCSPPVRGSRHCNWPARTLAGMGAYELLHTADGRHLWYFDYEQTTQLHTITVTTADGEVLTRLTMTSDQFQQIAGALARRRSRCPGEPCASP